MQNQHLRSISMMTILSRRYNTLYIIVLLFVSILPACVYGNKTKDADLKNHSVLIFDGLHMGELLDKPEKLKSASEVKSALNKNWYAGITVKSTNNKVTRVIDNCHDYFIAYKEGLIPLKEYEISAYSEFAMMCTASREIINAKPASASFLNELILDKAFPNLMPKQLAMIISQSESQKALNNNKLTYWSDVNKIVNVDVKTNYQAIYKHKGAAQTIEFVAKGDFNGDAIEDLIITSRDVVEGGSYNAIRMFLITKKSSNTNYILLKEYRY